MYSVHFTVLYSSEQLRHLSFPRIIKCRLSINNNSFLLAKHIEGSVNITVSPLRLNIFVSAILQRSLSAVIVRVIPVIDSQLIIYEGIARLAWRAGQRFPEEGVRRVFAQRCACAERVR